MAVMYLDWHGFDEQNAGHGIVANSVTSLATFLLAGKQPIQWSDLAPAAASRSGSSASESTT